MVVEDIAMPHLRSQRTGRGSAWRSLVHSQDEPPSKSKMCEAPRLQPSTSTLRKCPLPAKPSLSLQHFDEGGERRLEAAFKSVIRYSLGAATTDFADENVAGLDKKPNIVLASSVGLPETVPGNEIHPKVAKKKKSPCPKGFDGMIFSLEEDMVETNNLLHRCKSCSISCREYFGEFFGFPKIEVSDETDGTIVDDLGSSFYGFDFPIDENDAFYGFEETANPQMTCTDQLEVSGLKPCSVVLYRVKPCSVVLQKLNCSVETGAVPFLRNAAPHHCRFPVRNGKLLRSTRRSNGGHARGRVGGPRSASRRAGRPAVQFALLNKKSNFVFNSKNSISVTVWDQFQEACNLSLQKEYVEDFCGFNHLHTLH